ncbi:hypothetical protein [Methylobacterium oryzae]|uniref:hypothetical protein n=1 Tax=Methylobacterium oryzae TaxID=334852 RepID=UPI002F354EF3
MTVVSSPGSGSTSISTTFGPPCSMRRLSTCRINLDGTGGGVRIVPGCHDSGLEVFDPVRWRYAKGRMTLTAKRGHSIDLVPSGDGRWRRDPEVGTTFVLRRVD